MTCGRTTGIIKRKNGKLKIDRRKVIDNEKEINDDVFMYDGRFISLW